MAAIDAAAVAMRETVWLEANTYYEAERRYYESLPSVTEQPRRSNPIHHYPCVEISAVVRVNVNQYVYTTQRFENFLKDVDTEIELQWAAIADQLKNIEKEYDILQQNVERVRQVSNLTTSLSQFIKKCLKMPTNQAKDTALALKKNEPKGSMQTASTSAAHDDDLDLFGSDERHKRSWGEVEKDEAFEDADAAKLSGERLQAYANKKAKKSDLVAKSSVVLDVEPWDDETDMKAMETAVKGIQCEGLVWGESKLFPLVPLAYGIKKLKIVAIVEDEKVSVEWLHDSIMAIDLKAKPEITSAALLFESSSPQSIPPVT